MSVGVGVGDTGGVCSGSVLDVGVADVCLVSRWPVRQHECTDELDVQWAVRCRLLRQCVRSDDVELLGCVCGGILVRCRIDVDDTDGVCGWSVQYIWVRKLQQLSRGSVRSDDGTDERNVHGSVQCGILRQQRWYDGVNLQWCVPCWVRVSGWVDEPISHHMCNRSIQCRHA